ncbi:MAG: hypothetical protein P0S96_02080 [Simkaniaceae bacterium]|nr:hypothetical protein [Candidatus Sacchlamyda saccharinae]
MTTLNELPGSGTLSPLLETTYEDFGDIEASNGSWGQAYFHYCSALESTEAKEVQDRLLAKANNAFKEHQSQASKEAQGTIELCNAQLRGRSLMKSEAVAVLVENKALAQIQLRDFDGAIKTCNLSLKGKFNDIPHATSYKISEIQKLAEVTRLAAQGLVAFGD